VLAARETETIHHKENFTMSELSERIAELGITMQSTHVALEPWNDDDRKQLCDRWECVLSYQGKEMRVPSYRQGLGNRKLALGIKKEGMTTWVRTYTGDCVRSYEAAAKQGLIVPVAPSVADVLSALLLDASSGEETFVDFCDNMGVDSDSRKQLNVYLECQKTLVELRRKFLGYDLFNELRNLEH
jgi:hypothetical protein